MLDTPKVTVVTTTYNFPSVLKLAMETVLEQTFAEFEYLVIGDGCTDETEDVVRSFQDERIRWRNLPTNLGNQSDVNRIALDMARAPLIAYLNHDDLWFPEHLEVLHDCVRNGGFDLASSLCLSISPPPYYHRKVVGLPAYKPKPDVFKVVSMTSTVMHSKQVAEEAGGWKPWRDTQGPPTTEFFDRVRAQGDNHAVVPRITCLKFHSAQRRDSYRNNDDSEYLAWRRMMKEDPDLRHREMAVAIALNRSNVQPPRVERPQNAPPGWLIEHYRRSRGLEPKFDLGEWEPTPEQLELTDNNQVVPVAQGQEGQIWFTPRDLSRP